MIAVLVLPGLNAGMFGLDEHLPLSMLPLGDRPFLQHIIEYLVLQGVTAIEFVIEHLPERVEGYFGDGTRWGAKFRYHLAMHPEFAYRSLRVLTAPLNEPWLLAHGDRFAFAPFRSFEQAASPVSFMLANSGERDAWSGVALFPNWSFAGQVAEFSTEKLGRWLSDAGTRSEVLHVETSRWIGAESPCGLLESQGKLLRREIPEMMIGGIETDPGVWISRNVTIHPSAKLIPPVYLGPNSRLGEGVQVGPNTVVSGSCVLDKHTTAVQSLIMAGSYVGQSLELDHAIVHRQLLINARLGTGVAVREDFLLGGITEAAAGPPFHRWAHATVAAILLLALSPLAVLGILLLLVMRGRLRNVAIVRTPAPPDPAAWRTVSLLIADRVPWGQRASGVALFFGRFLPGLLAVLRGDLAMVGLPPRTLNELQSLDPDWRNLALAHPAGLVAEADVVLDSTSGSTEAYLADAVYIATKSRRHNASLMASYAMRCLGGSNVRVQSEEVQSQ